MSHAPVVVTVELPPLHRTQEIALKTLEHSRFLVMAAGRRWGKTVLGVNVSLERAMQGKRVWWVAPTYQTARIAWRELGGMAIQVPGAVVTHGRMEVKLPNGGEVVMRSADRPYTLRGEGLDFVVLDEAAFLREETWTHVLRPALADRQGSALFISTPKGRNWYWSLWNSAEHSAGWNRLRFTSYDNPLIPPEELDALKEQLSERVWRQEIMAEFISDEGMVFRKVHEAVDPAAWQEEPVAGHEYVVGVDWGQAEDYTVIMVLDATDRAFVWYDRFRRIDYATQLARLEVVVSKWHPVVVVVETNSMGSPLAEELERRGMPVRRFATTSASKQYAVQALALAFEKGEVTIPADDVMQNELMAFEATKLPSGAVRYAAPAGAHDDVVMAMVFAWSEVQEVGTRVLFMV